VILSLAVFLVAGCAGHPEGMKSPRELTDSEKDRVIEMALNTREASEWLKKENIYKTELEWIATVWENSEISGFWQIAYDWEADANLKNVPESAIFYPGVLIRFGEPELWQVMAAVDLKTEKVVLVQQNPFRTGPATGLKVRDASEARDTALTYLREHEGQNAPTAGIEWQAEDITPPGLVGVGMKEFASDEWTIKVSYPIVAPENTVYQVVVSSVKLGWHWKGSVDADGNVTEVSAFKQMSEAESWNLAEEFVRNSPTFVFDGITDTFRLADTLTARCPYCWVFIFEFDSAHAGYGDRTGQALAEVITHHKASIAVEQLEITSAVMDSKWDMIRQEMISSQQEKPEGTLSVAELLANPVYDTEVRIYGEVSALGELFCPCFELNSGGETIVVWYDLMVANDGTERPAVDVQGINNGDNIVVTGELKGEGGTHYSKGDFWASAIVVPL